MLLLLLNPFCVIPGPETSGTGPLELLAFKTTQSSKLLLGFGSRPSPWSEISTAERVWLSLSVPPLSPPLVAQSETPSSRGVGEPVWVPAAVSPSRSLSPPASSAPPRGPPGPPPGRRPRPAARPLLFLRGLLLFLCRLLLFLRGLLLFLRRLLLFLRRLLLFLRYAGSGRTRRAGDLAGQGGGGLLFLPAASSRPPPPPGFGRSASSRHASAGSAVPGR
ncbi:hypothetical protein ANANG_G00264230, partial [Anguilla anguilla]